MRKLYSIIILIGLSSSAIAQDGIGYYYDYTNHLFVFEKGNTTQLESNHVDSLKTGTDYLVYVDDKNSLILYYNSEKQTLEEFIPKSMVATSHAFVYKMDRRLMICENGQKKQLSKFVGSYFASDSIVVWQSEPDLNIMAYENGEIKTVESTTVSTNVINDGKVGKNIFAYNNLNYNFKIYYKNKVYDTEGSRITDYQCGKDIVAYVDKYKNTFNVFYNGETKVVSDQIIKSYMVCDGTVAFEDVNNNFFIYYNGSLTKIDSYSPEYYFTQNNIIYYSYHSELKIVYEGKIYTERLIEQQNIIAGINSILYSDNSNKAKYFYKGKTIDNFYVQKPYTMELHGDLPVFRYGNNTIAFLYNGRLYEYGVRAN